MTHKKYYALLLKTIIKLLWKTSQRAKCTIKYETKNMDES